MAKVRRPLKEPRETQSSPFFTDSFLGDLSPLDLFLYVGIFLVTLVIPFLYSRLTTENFLTPKEFTCKEAMAILGAAYCLKFLFEGKITLARTKLDMPLVLFFLLWIISIAWNYNMPSAIRDLRGCFLVLLLYPLIVNVVRYRWQFDGILWAMVAAGVLTSLLGLMEAYNWYFRWDAVSGWWVFCRDEIFAGRIDYQATYLPLFPQLASKDYNMASIVSTFGNRNYLGTFSMFTAFIPLAFCFYYENYVVRALSFVFFTIMAIGLFITRCRAAAIGIVAGVFFMFLVVMFVIVVLQKRGLQAMRKNVVFFAGVLIVLSIITGLAATTSSFSMVDKLKLSFTLNRQTSNTNERVWVWYGTYQSFAKNPFKWLFGSGFGAFKHFFPLQEAETYSNENKETFTSVTFRQTHNDWLQLVSELGLVGLALFLWICWRFFMGIIAAIREDISTDGGRAGIRGRHVLLIGLGTAMVSQLVAAVPDFPFHRIETALYAVIVLALVPLFCETRFFQKPLPTTNVAGADFAIPFGVIGIIAGSSGFYFEYQCRVADEMVRDAEYRITSRDAQQVADAKLRLFDAVSRDSLPGDPYLKIATVFEMEGKAQEAMAWTDKAWKNINFNARSTYHSVIFRKMHIAYHVMGDRPKAMEYAREGLRLTCSEARSIYYFYIGKIAMDMGDLPNAEFGFKNALNYASFATQAGANLAVVLATEQKWQEALTLAASISANIGNSDPTMLDVIGICATNLGQLATAEAALRRAIELKDDQPVYNRDLGIVLLRMNKFEEAQYQLEKAFTSAATPPHIKPELQSLLATMSQALRDQGIALLRAGKTTEGVQSLKKAFDSKVIPPNLKEELQRMLTTLGALKPEKAPIAPIAPEVVQQVLASLNAASPSTIVPVSIPATPPAIMPPPAASSAPVAPTTASLPPASM